MKVVRYEADGRRRCGLVEGAFVRDAGADVLAPRPTGAELPLDEVRLLAPVAAPGKVVGVGRNYREHAAETGAAVPTEPQLFAKWANAVIGPGAPIVRPPITGQLDYEAELTVVIGRRARRVGVADALDHVYGYTCGNDVSARDLQFGDTQWTRGKALDGFAPMGPWIVTADEIPDPQTLPIRCLVNGETLQDANTSEMVFSVAEILEFVTEAITLEPGDVVMTGTPPGVGMARTPPRFLHPGDVVRVEIGGIGALENPVAGPSAHPE
jgi:2-keto-4-pentenoate hydratase/2-oxohepta-3-ene-1,7-dioic acid hydratase in catechol pathway